MEAGSRQRRIMGVALSVTLAVLTACSDAAQVVAPADALAAKPEWAGDPGLSQALATVRAATAQFHDIDVALAAGYALGSPCESRAEGAMGHHYPNRTLMGTRGVRGTPPLVWGDDAVIDVQRPEVLLYEPQADGSMRLVAVEYLVFAAAWDAVNSEPPTFAGVPFEYKAGVDAHGFEPHYELHVWVWRQNPLGTFYAWNPKVSCP
jgi:hypothetical protein